MKAELQQLGMRLLDLAAASEVEGTASGPRTRWASPQEAGELVAGIVANVKATQSLGSSDAELRMAIIKVIRPYVQPPSQAEIEAAWKAFTQNNPHATPESIFKAGYSGSSSETWQGNSSPQG